MVYYLFLTLTLMTAEGLAFPNPSVKSQTALFLKKVAPKQGAPSSCFKYLYISLPNCQKFSLGYVPKGFSPEGWAFFKAEEQREHHKKKKHLKSRSLVDFQKELETGKGETL